MSFDRAPPARPLDALGLLFVRLGVDGSNSPEVSPTAVVIAPVIVVEGIVAEEMR